MSRLYVPVTAAQLSEFAVSEGVPESVERFVAPGDDEESEYAALMAAAEASRQLSGGRRIVIVAEVSEDDEDAALPILTWQAIHADSGDDAEDDADLGWFAVQELQEHVLDR